MNCLLSMNESARRCVFCTVSKTWQIWTSALWCENVHRTHIISLVFWICWIKVDKCLRTYYKLSRKICEYGKNNQQSHDYDYAFFKSTRIKNFDFVGWVIKTPCVFNKLTSVFYASVLLLIMNFVITLIKVTVDPRGDSRVDPQTTLIMLWRNSMSITG